MSAGSAHPTKFVLCFPFLHSLCICDDLLGFALLYPTYELSNVNY